MAGNIYNVSIHDYRKKKYHVKTLRYSVEPFDFQNPELEAVKRACKWLVDHGFSKKEIVDNFYCHVREDYVPASSVYCLAQEVKERGEKLFDK